MSTESETCVVLSTPSFNRYLFYCYYLFSLEYLYCICLIHIIKLTYLQGPRRGRGWGTVEPRHNEGPRDWQIIFVITRFLFKLPYILLLLELKKRNSLLDRGLLYIEVPL